MLSLDFDAGNADAWSKELPAKGLAPDQVPDAYRLGHGPVYFKKENDEGKQG